MPTSLTSPDIPGLQLSIEAKAKLMQELRKSIDYKYPGAGGTESIETTIKEGIKQAQAAAGGNEGSAAVKTLSDINKYMNTVDKFSSAYKHGYDAVHSEGLDSYSSSLRSLADSIDAFNSLNSSPFSPLVGLLSSMLRDFAWGLDEFNENVLKKLEDAMGGGSGGDGSGDGGSGGGDGGSGGGDGGSGGGSGGDGGSGRGDPSLPGGLPGSPNPTNIDPLVLDLDGLGLSLTSVSGSPAHFDFQGNGFAIQTGWVGSGDGMLVLAPMDGATITAQNILGIQSGDAFTDLRALDLNGDGKINANDAAYNTLRIWIDNGDASSTAGELYSLQQLGISSIDLSEVAGRQIVNGNTVISSATFQITVDGVEITRSLYEVYFSVNTTLSHYTPPEGFEYSLDATKLPQLAGFGTLPDLWIAMSQNTGLRAQVQALVLNANSISSTDFRSSFEALVQNWAGVDDVDPSSRGQYVDAKHLGVIYAFYGIDEALNPAFAGNPNWHNGPDYFEPLYEGIIDALLTRFASQVLTSQLQLGVSFEDALAGPYAAFAGLELDVSTNLFTGHISEVIAYISDAAPKSGAAAVSYWQISEEVLSMLKTEGKAYILDATRAMFSCDIPQSVIDSVLPSFFDVIGTANSDAIGTASHPFGQSNNTIYLGKGDDSVYGDYIVGETIIYASGDGNDTYRFWNRSATTNALELVDLKKDGVVLTRVGNNLQVKVIATGEVVTISNQFAGSENGIDHITFADGTAMDHDAIRAAAWIRGTDGNDMLGTSSSALQESNLTFDLGKGDDRVYVDYAGHETIIYAKGDGNDTYRIWNRENASSVLKLTDLNADDVALSRVGNDLYVKVSETGEMLRFVDQLAGNDHCLSQIVFADGSIMSHAEIQAAAWYRGTDGNDVLGTSSNPLKVSNSTFDLGKGDDSIYVDYAGHETIIYAKGDGNDTYRIWNRENASSVLKLTDLNSDDVVLSRVGNDLYVKVSETGEMLKFVDQLAGNDHCLSQIVFADGSIMSHAEIQAAAWYRGTDGNDTLGTSSSPLKVSNSTFDLGKGNDSVYIDYAGHETIVYAKGDGNDTYRIWNRENASSVLKLTDLNSDDVVLSRVGNDLYVKVSETGEMLRFVDQLAGNDHCLSQIVFADGSIMSHAEIQAAAWYRGTDGNDTLGTSSSPLKVSNSTFDLGKGDDSIYGDYVVGETVVYASGDGNDTYRFWNWSTTANKMQLTNLNSDDVILIRVGNDLKAIVKATSEIITVTNQFASSEHGLDHITFANGTALDHATIQLTGTIAGVLGASSSNDILNGTLANELLNGLTGDDQLYGNAGNDILVGAAGNDVLNGGIGNDHLIGGAGSDTFHFDPGFGHDTIEDFSVGDVIEFASSVFADYSHMLGAATEVDGNAVIVLDEYNSVTLHNVALASLSADEFRFVA